jgi:histidinol phosphatase-like enzyme
MLNPNDPNAKPVGVFALRLRLGAEMTYMTAFLVKSGSSQYLLTHSILKSYVDEGYELTLMGKDGKEIKNNIATFLGVDEDYELAYLFADGMKDFEPLKFSRDKFSTQVALVLSFLNSNYSAAKDNEFRSYDFARFSQLTDRYFVEEKKEITLQWLGCPVLPDRNTMEVQGICTAIKDKSDDMVLGIINFEKLELNSSYALGAKPVEMIPAETVPIQTEPTQVATEAEEEKEEQEQKSEGGNGLVVLLIVLLALACTGGGFCLFKLMQNTKQGTSGAAYMAQWNLKGVSGPLNGLVFPVFGAVRMGCGRDVAIRFPENTLGISDVHCEVINTGSGLVVRDLESAYGTYMSIQKLEPFAEYALKDGDIFSLAPNGPSFQVVYKADGK